MNNLLKNKPIAIYWGRHPKLGAFFITAGQYINHNENFLTLMVWGTIQVIKQKKIHFIEFL